MSSFVHQLEKILFSSSGFVIFPFRKLQVCMFFFFSNNHGQKGTFRTAEDKINSVPDESVHIQTVRD